MNTIHVILLCTIYELYAEDGYAFCNREVRILKALYIKYDKLLMVVVSLVSYSNTELYRDKHVFLIFAPKHRSRAVLTCIYVLSQNEENIIFVLSSKSISLFAFKIAAYCIGMSV